jgi:DNA-binding MarR family transcriptional regulator
MLMNPLCNRLSLRQATRRVTQLCDQALAPLDLRATQLSMLREIDRLGPIALNPLAEAMVMDRATPDHNVRSLEMRGLVRLAVGADRRSRQVTLTPKGRALPARAWKLWRKAQAVLGRGTDARWLLAAGLLVMAAGNYWMSQMNLDISPGQVVWPRVLIVLGLSMCFAPAEHQRHDLEFLSGVVRFFSSVSTTNTASRRAGSVSLAFSLTP